MIKLPALNHWFSARKKKTEKPAARQPTPFSRAPDDRLVLVDVGSAGGVQAKWLPHAEWLQPVLFEPNPQSAKRLREKQPGCQVIEAGLSNADERRALQLTKNPFCVSVLPPNQALLAHYPNMQPHFEVKGQLEVSCTRYDTLHRAGTVPKPEAIKIDVQGFEYEVLQGFGDLLDNCLGIEMETHFYPLYKGQKLLHDLVDLLEPHGLVLRRLYHVPHFRGDMVEVDAFFTRRRSQFSSLSASQRWKMTLIEQVWELPEK